jgi:amidase
LGYDKELKRSAKLKPLQCIPVVLKDNFDTADLPTTGASLALKGMQSTKDAFTVARFRQNGALILGITNMHELALFGLTSSSLGGQKAMRMASTSRTTRTGALRSMT